MATEIAFSANVDLGDGAKSLKALKQEFKETQKELDGLTQGSEQYIQTLKKLGKVKDDIGDLNDEIKAFHPEGKIQAFGNVLGGLASGFQAATAATVLFGGENKELEKTLLKIQAVMAFTEGIKGVFGLADSFKVLGNVVKATAIEEGIASEGVKELTIVQKLWNAAVAANPLVIFVALLAAAAAGIYYLTQQFTGQKSEVEKLQTAYEDLKAANEILNHEYDNEIKILESLGGQEEKINGLKREKLILIKQEAEASAKISAQKLQEAINETSWTEKLLALTGNSGAANAQKVKEVLTANQEVIKSNQAVADAEVNIQVLDNTIHRQKIDNVLKKAEAAKKLADEEMAAAQAVADKEMEIDAWRVEKDLAISLKKQEDAANDLIAYQEAIAAIQAEDAKYLADKAEKDKADAERAKQLRQEEFNQRVEIATTATQAVTALSDLYFYQQLKKAHGNAAAELAIKKKQFKVDKALGITRAVIDGVRSVQAALTIAPPAGYVMAGLNAVLAVANVAKIASQKFDGGGGGSVASITAPSGGDAPAINAPTNSNTLLNPDGSVQNPQLNKPPIVKAIVVESEMTITQNKVKGIQENATIK